jgi:hypothetical protein
MVAALALVGILAGAVHGETRVALRAPTPEVVHIARSMLDLPMGTERYLDVDGKRCVFVVEPHYHPPGFVGGPQGWHKGVSVYEVREGHPRSR